MSAAAPAAAPRWGRPFIHRGFDVAVIGGGLSLVLVPVFAWSDRGALSGIDLMLLLLLCNSAHFAASTVRLYSKPGALAMWPFLTCGLPLVALGVLTLCIAGADWLAPQLQALAFTWSPYHYAAQTFGLATMYCHRSGFALRASDRRLLYAACLLPFSYAFAGGQGIGLDWFVPADWLEAPGPAQLRASLVTALGIATLAAPVVLFLRLHDDARGWPPRIVACLILSNGVWWVVFPFLHAFAWATIFHAVQYLAIVSIFHVRDQRTAGNSSSGGALTLRFYAVCLVLAYVLFHLVPRGYAAAGFVYGQSVLMTIAMINIHHFIVDRYIWRVRRDAANQAVVQS